jgi:hypothetical protein
LNSEVPPELSFGLVVSDIMHNIRDVFWSVGGLRLNVVASDMRGASDS